MSESLPIPCLLTSDHIARMEESTRAHLFNPNGVRRSRSLGDATGMKRIGVHLVRLQPGRESTEYHTHSHDEEWIYVLGGRGMSEIDGRTVEVAAGDFMGFPAGSPPHTMTNPFDADLVYLVGGTREPYDVVDYPRKGIRSFKYDGRRDNVRIERLDSATPLARAPAGGPATPAR